MASVKKSYVLLGIDKHFHVLVITDLSFSIINYAPSATFNFDLMVNFSTILFSVVLPYKEQTIESNLFGLTMCLDCKSYSNI